MLIFGILSTSVASAEPSPTVQTEVNFLLRYTEQSGCDFYRNGTWHDAKAAQTHLRDKYNYLVERNMISSVDDFIQKAATQSSFTGQVYLVRCNGSAPVTSSLWLYAELARYRKF